MLHIDPIDMALLAINLLVLYLILRKFLFGPVTRVIEARQKRIHDQLAQATATIAEADRVRDEYEGKLAAAGQQARELLQNSKSMSERDYQLTMAAAKDESRALITATQAQLARERAEMIDGVRREVASLAILAASRVSVGRLNVETDESLLDAFLEETGEES